MLLAYKALYSFNVDRNSGEFKAPFNVIANEARVFTPADTAVSTPNSDTPYSMVQLDLRAEPVVISVPEVPRDRYYDVQFADFYSFNYAYVGSRATGSRAGSYMVAGPNWQGETPPGIRQVFRCETQFGLVVFRTQLFGPDDMDNVRAVQAGYRAQPLSAFLGRPPAPAAPPVDWLPFTRDALTTRFAEYLSFILQFCPATGTAAVERPMRERFAAIGIGGRRPAGSSPSGEAERAAMGDAVRTAMGRIRARANSMGIDINGWRVGSAGGDRSHYNGDWELRAAVALNGIYGNNPEEATYPFARHDATGAELDGSKHAYSITFPADGLPPVNAFWSVTMYETSTMLLVANPIDRYLINSPMLSGMKRNPDGSLTIYVQHESPGPERESNWLPAPAAPMSIVLRMYWPKTEQPSILPIGQGQWRPPPIVPTGNTRAERVTRFGDKSLETVIRTDDRYGHDGLFQGPRGWPYWNFLESPRPIQNPNLWPDMQSTYFLARFALPAGASMTLRGAFPRARYFQFALYRAERGTFVGTGEAFSGADIAPDSGATNPFRAGADRLSDRRGFTLTVLAADPPADRARRAPNTLYAGRAGGELQSVMRIYLSGPRQRRRRLRPRRRAAARARPARLRRAPGRRHAAVGAAGGRALRPAHRGQRRAAADRRAMGGPGACGGQRPDARPRHRTGAARPEMGEVLEHPLLDPRCLQDRRGARAHPVRKRDRRRRRPDDAVFPHAHLAEVRAGLCDARQDAAVSEHLRRDGWWRPRGHAAGADAILVAGQLRGRAVRPDRGWRVRHAGAARCRAQLHHRRQPPRGPPRQRDGKERRRLGEVEPARRRAGGCTQPRRLRHAHAAHHGGQPRLGGKPREGDAAGHGGGRHGPLPAAWRIHRQGDVRGDVAPPVSGASIRGDEDMTITFMTAARALLGAGLLALLAGPAVAQQGAARVPTPGEQAARGPLPGDVALYGREWECSQALPTPGYFRSLNGAEISDAQRSGMFPCATFTGSMTGPNRVFAYRADGDYQGISYMNNRRPGELYLVGGEYPTPDDPIPAGPFIAKVNATTGREIWRTYVDNPNASGRWIGNANLNILENGRIAFSWSNQIVLVDGDTGEILRHNRLPAGDAPVADVNFKHMTIAPDGTLIMKNQTRPAGCTMQGTMAILRCQGRLPNSHLVAVNPDTLEILAELTLPEPAISPHIVAPFDGRIAIYIGYSESVRRAFWDPATRRLSHDPTWVVRPMREGQSAATAPTIVGDWVAVQLNGAGSRAAPSSVVVAHQRDATRQHTIFPFGERLEPGAWSFAPPKTGADSENNMIYSADAGVGKVAGIRIDPATGDLSTVFVLDVATTTFQPVIGPRDRRVLLLTNMRMNDAAQPRQAAMFGGQYREQLTWRDAATGRLLAESDFFEPLTINSLTPPGFGGRVYFPTAIGRGFYVLQATPANASSR